jgi:hypothetical protein
LLRKCARPCRLCALITSEKTSQLFRPHRAIVTNALAAGCNPLKMSLYTCKQVKNLLVD